jgi:4-amino-4-deoxy-L-arabinose transferase-like glycosyltransferase
LQSLQRVDRHLTKSDKINAAPSPLTKTRDKVFPENGTVKSTQNWKIYIAVLVVACAVYLACVVTPPSLMDDVDAVHAQIARTMLQTGDWVTPRLDGVVDFEKPPLIYWAIAVSYKIFGVHDWAARIPTALSAISLCLLTAAFGVWAFGRRAGMYAGICLATCVGLFLFTRVLMPDIMLALAVAGAMYAFLRVVEDGEPHPRLWACVLGASLGAGLLVKSAIAILFPAATGLIYLYATHQLFLAQTWKRLQPFLVIPIALLISAPWYILATLRNPPYFVFTLHAGPGLYHGFLWFLLVNEQILRYLNMRYPRDYSSVSDTSFWLLHLVWLFPWSFYFPAIAKLSFKPVERAGRARLFALCWVGFTLVFLTFSETQEYYSMPCYAALALLLGTAIAEGGVWVRRGTRALSVVAACGTAATLAILFLVRHVPAPGDIASALSSNPYAYTMALGHMSDLTINSFAYLRTPLFVASVAFLVGALGMLRPVGQRAFLATALMMVLFFHAAHMALVVFDPYLSSRPLADALMHSPEGTLVTEGHYYPLSSIFFYTDREGLLWAVDRVNLEYGSYAPGAPDVFVSDAQLKDLWLGSERCYFVLNDSTIPQFEKIIGSAAIHSVASSGGKELLVNHAPNNLHLLEPSVGQ